MLYSLIMKRIAFILGNNLALSLAEIMSLLKKNNCQLIDQVAIFDLNLNKNEISVLMQRLGGSIKIGEVVFTTSASNLKTKLKEAVVQELERKNVSSKFNFAFSSFKDLNFNYKEIAIEIKESLRVRGFSSRWVNLLTRATDSASSYHNKLTSDKGVEFLLIKHEDVYIVIKILELQAFSDYSDRDYGRPKRDSFSGMLPPKLAKMMLNLGNFSLDDKLLDPFCGSGTIISEALFLGARDIVGSDISKKAISDTRDNVDWLRKKYNLAGFKLELIKHKVQNLSKSFKENSFDIIVTEPYLGPQRAKVDYSQIKKELEYLYAQALKELFVILKPGKSLVMIWPIFSPENNPVYLYPHLNNFKLITCNFLQEKKLSSFRGTLIYGRKNQKVWREVLVLKKP